jgi:hypothetical protein
VEHAAETEVTHTFTRQCRTAPFPAHRGIAPFQSREQVTPRDGTRECRNVRRHGFIIERELLIAARREDIGPERRSDLVSHASQACACVHLVLLGPEQHCQLVPATEAWSSVASFQCQQC